MRSRPSRFLVLIALVLLAVACGARVSDDQVASAGRSGSAGGSQDLSPGSGDGGTGDVGSSDGGSADQGGGTAATDGTSSGSSGGGAAGPVDNGGATDIGITGDTITVGNISTLSGPVPGIFQGAVIGAQAVAAYQNAQGGIFGRKIKVDVRDDQFDTGQNRSATIDQLSKVFAFMGSFSLYDDAAAGQIQSSGIPDVSYSLSKGRREIANNFSVQPAYDGGAPTSGFIWFKQHYPDAITAVGAIYGDVPASKASHVAYKAASESVGFKWVYDRGVQPTESDYTADVVRMRQAGVKMVFLIATDDKTTARLAKAMTQQGFKPQVFSANYMPTIMALGGESVEGMLSPSGSALFGGEDSTAVPEVGLMNQWVQKIKPGFKSDVFSTYAWASGRLLFQALQAAGPKPTRASVLAELRKIDKFSANNLLSEAGPATKRPSTCMLMAQVKNGKYVRVEPATGFFCLGPYHRS
jgi:ABC-type branched-subunit amino acid transport system substrate-binding protein